MGWLERGVLAFGVLLALNVWFAYDRLGQATQRAVAYQATAEQWQAYGEQEHRTALGWAAAAETYRIERDHYVKRLNEAEAEREALVQQVAHLEQQQAPFSLDFLRWADSGVTRCESTDNPRAQSGTHYGLLQIHLPSHEARIAKHGYTPADLLRPIPNLIVAESIWREQGAGPWPVCGSKRGGAR